MRIALALIALLTAACSTTECRHCANSARTAYVIIDTDKDGLPDARTEGFGFTTLGMATFTDSDDDGLPDTRIMDFAPTNENRLESKLLEIEQAIAELRRELERR